MNVPAFARTLRRDRREHSSILYRRLQPRSRCGCAVCSIIVASSTLSATSRANADHALSTAKRIAAGVVAINTSNMHNVGLPFGGYKNSGVGGEEALEELLSYTQVKAVHIAL